MFQDSGNNIIMIDLNVALEMFAPFLVASNYFVHKSEIWAMRSPPSANHIPCSAFSTPMAANSDIAPYDFVTEFHISAADPSILIPSPTGFLQL